MRGVARHRRARPERLLLVGAGHSHLHLLRHGPALSDAGYDVTLVAPNTFHYSGSAIAVATGALPESAGRINVETVAAHAGIRHVTGHVCTLDSTRKTALTDTGVSITWDVVAVNVGSVVRTFDGCGDDILPAKPTEQLRNVLAVEPSDDRPVLVIGAGPSGIEIAAQLSCHARPVTLVSSTADIGAALPASARDRLREILTRRGIEVVTGRRVERLAHHRALLDDRTTLPYAAAVLTTGLVAPPELAQWGIGDGRGIPVMPTLRHVTLDEVYATGDCARFLPKPLARIGVHGVRQGPVLLAALLARRAGRPEPVYRPRAHHLAILDLGDGDALAVRGNYWFEGPAALALKRRIDARWLAQHS